MLSCILRKVFTGVHYMNRMKGMMVFFLLMVIFLPLFSENGTEAGFSLGTGIGQIRHDFKDSGVDKTLVYTAPAVYLDGEFAGENVYLNIALSVLFLPINVSMGGDAVNLENYSMNSAADMTLIGIGYRYPLNDKMELGASLGFHMSMISLVPPNEDTTMLTLDGYYGLIGLSVTPRIRYALSENTRIALNIPIGLDFGKMSEENTDASGNPTGTSNPAVIYPDTLEALYKGFTLGIYVSVGYYWSFH